MEQHLKLPKYCTIIELLCQYLMPKINLYIIQEIGWVFFEKAGSKPCFPLHIARTVLSPAAVFILQKLCKTASENQCNFLCNNKKGANPKKRICTFSRACNMYYTVFPNFQRLFVQALCTDSLFFFLCIGCAAVFYILCKKNLEHRSY